MNGNDDGYFEYCMERNARFEAVKRVLAALCIKLNRQDDPTALEIKVGTMTIAQVNALVAVLTQHDIVPDGCWALILESETLYIW